MIFCKNLKDKNVILASNSPRRKELMGFLCDDFQVIPSQAEEIIPKNVQENFSDIAGESAMYLATLKAVDVAKNHKNAVVFGCDTIVAVGDKILGKPKNDDDARKMLRLLSGKSHRVLSGVCICYGQIQESFFVETKVKFHDLTEDLIENYIATGEHRDKAGAYGIQGFGSILCEEIQGDFFNVVGFPVSEIYRRLDKILVE